MKSLYAFGLAALLSIGMLAPATAEIDYYRPLMVAGITPPPEPTPDCTLNEEGLTQYLAGSAVAYIVYDEAQAKKILQAYNELNPAAAINYNSVVKLYAIKFVATPELVMVAMFNKDGCLLYRATLKAATWEQWVKKAGLFASGLAQMPIRFMSWQEWQLERLRQFIRETDPGFRLQ